MTLPLTPDVLEGAYEYLRRTRPFRDWNLPEPEDVKFKITRNKDTFGSYQIDGTDHIISISARLIGRTDQLLQTMAHEMVHLHQECAGMWDRNPHSKAFLKLAARVCYYHGWDPKVF